MCTFNVFMFKSVQESKKWLYLTYLPENIYCGLFEESQFLPSYVGMWSTVCSLYTKCPVHTTTTNRYVLYSNHALQLWRESSPQQWQQQFVHGRLCLTQWIHKANSPPTRTMILSKVLISFSALVINLLIWGVPNSALASLLAFHLILYHRD
jgi:hypothetical protein